MPNTKNRLHWFPNIFTNKGPIGYIKDILLHNCHVYLLEQFLAPIVSLINLGSQLNERNHSLKGDSAIWPIGWQTNVLATAIRQLSENTHNSHWSIYCRGHCLLTIVIFRHHSYATSRFVSLMLKMDVPGMNPETDATLVCENF